MTVLSAMLFEGDMLFADLADAMARIAVLEGQGSLGLPCTEAGSSNPVEGTPEPFPADPSPGAFAAGSQSISGDRLTAMQSCSAVEKATQTDANDIPLSLAVETSVQTGAPAMSSPVSSSMFAGARELPSPSGDADPEEMAHLSLLFFPSAEEGASSDSDPCPSSCLDEPGPDRSDSPSRSSPAAAGSCISGGSANSLHHLGTVKHSFSPASSRAASQRTAADSPGPAEHAVQETLPASGAVADSPKHAMQNISPASRAAADSPTLVEYASKVLVSTSGAAADGPAPAIDAVKETPPASRAAANSPAPTRRAMGLSIAAGGAAAASPAVARCAKKVSTAASGAATASPAVARRHVIAITANGAAGDRLLSRAAALPAAALTSTGAAGGSRASDDAAVNQTSPVFSDAAADISIAAVQGFAGSSLVPHGVTSHGVQGRFWSGLHRVRRYLRSPWVAQPDGAPASIHVPHSRAPPSHAADAAADLDGWLQV